MKLNETVASSRRIGPLKAVDGSGNPVVDFSAPGSVTVSVNDGAFVAAGGTITVIGGGYVYYNATAGDASVRGFITVKLDVVCVEHTFREEVELAPQGIIVNEPAGALRRVGPLRVVDVNGNELASLVGVTVEVSRNGAAWAAPAGATTLIEAGYADYAAAAADVSSIGWVAVKLTGACQEFVFRSTVVAETVLGTGSGPTVPVEGEDTVAIARFQGGDLALTWSALLGNADISLIDTDLQTDLGLVTAALLSLLLDRRAEPDDKPPSGDPRDRRGWWADELAEIEGDLIGSRLWLLDRSTLSNETVLRAKEYVREGLAWMLEDRVVQSIEATTETADNALWITVGLQRPNGDRVSFRFAHTWDHLQEAA